MNSIRRYPPINVLNVVKGLHSEKLAHHITPYRFETANGEFHRIAKGRQHTTENSRNRLLYINH